MKILFFEMNRQTTGAKRGVLYMLLAAFFFSLMNLMVRMLRQVMPPDVIVVYRSAIGALLLAFAWREIKPKPGQIFSKLALHFPRGLFGSLAMFLLYYSMQRLPMAMASLLTMTSVFWTLTLSFIFLKEKVSFRQLLWGGLGLLGIGLALMSGQNVGEWRLDPLGILSALGSGFLTGFAFTVLRKMRQSLPTREIVFYFGCAGAVLFFPFASLHWVFPQSVWELALIILIGVSATVAQLFMTSGFKELPAGLASMINLQQLTFTVLLGITFLKEIPPAGFYLSLLCVLVGLSGLFFSAEQSKSRA